MTADKIHIIGIGHKPLDDRSMNILINADVILAPGRLKEVFEGYAAYAKVKDKVVPMGRVDEMLAFIRENLGKRAMALLASGDPMFFGIGKRVVSVCGADRVEIIPDLSSVQAAFSRIKESWNDAFLVSLHGGRESAGEDALLRGVEEIPPLLGKHGKVAILTDGKSNPADLAKALAESPFADSVTVHVCENLGAGDREKVTTGAPAEIAARNFSDLNVVILIRRDEKDRSALPCFGLNEMGFDHSRGLITKDEVRAAVIHALHPPPRGVLWDIGAGCGSVSIEAARLAPGLAVYAVEKDEVQAGYISANKIRFGAANVNVINGRAPEILASLPAPDRAFIGGGGKETRSIIDGVSQRMAKGVIVITAVTLETLNDAIGSLEEGGYMVDIAQIGVSRSKPLAGRKQIVPLTQVFVIKGEKA